ncbi:MAG: adenine-specific DNA-methyltransferase [Blastomonas sp.]|nr:adenine-specific DNA-methyltransferase [Blastomonas sp.]
MRDAVLRVFESNENKIVIGDALRALKELPSDCVDLIFADPPYNIGKDFDGVNDKIDEKQFLEWCYEWLTECARVLKPSGSFYLMNSTQNMPALDLWCRDRFSILSRIVWAYDSSGVQAKRFFGSMYEPMLHMVADPKCYTFNASDILIEAKTGAKRGLIDYRKNPPRPYNTTKVPGNVWEYPRVRFKMEEYENHPSQKPEALLDRVIRASSNPGDLVLDPFAGSFSTAAVASRLGRRTLSFEINEAYLPIGLRRLRIQSDLPAEALIKQRRRKTQNLSKRQRERDLIEQPVLKLEL